MRPSASSFTTILFNRRGRWAHHSGGFRMSRYLLVATLLVAGALAGCTDKLSFGSAADDGSFSLSPTEGDKDTTFRVSAPKALRTLNLTWEWGDGTRSYGVDAEHVYGFTNGVMPITLIATGTEGLPQVATKTVTLGTGENALPTGSMAHTKTWVEAGRPVNLSVSNGRDADKDPLTYLWTYTVLSGGVASDGHDHDHGGSAPSPQAGGETVIDGTTQRVAVTFDAPGTYDVKVRIRDPKGGEAVDNKTISVSKHIPATQLTIPFSGRLAAGTAGTGVSEHAWNDAAPDTFVDAGRHAFELKYPATTYLFLQWNDTTNASAFDLDLELRNAETGEVLQKADNHAVNPAAPAPPTPLPAMEMTYGDIPAGKYVIVVRAYTGAQVDYTVNLFATLRITPELVAQVEG